MEVMHPAYFNLVAFLAICVVTTVLVFGIKESANLLDGLLAGWLGA
jgi:hypothetical protein